MYSLKQVVSEWLNKFKAGSGGYFTMAMEQSVFS